MEMDKMESIKKKIGETISISAQMTDENGDAIDLSGYTITSSLRINPDSGSTKLFDFTIDDSEYASGIVGMTISASNCATITQKKAYFDLKCIDGSSNVLYSDTVQILFANRVTT